MRLQPQSRLILVLEDDPPTRSNICDLLEEEGYATMRAATAEECLANFHSSSPDLILADINLPERDGFSVLKEIRSHPNGADIPFVFLSARSRLEDLRQGMTQGADDYLTKPFKASDLLAGIRTRLERYEGLHGGHRSLTIPLQTALDHLSARLLFDPCSRQPSLQWLRNRVGETWDLDCQAALLILTFRLTAEDGEAVAARVPAVAQSLSDRLRFHVGDDGFLAQMPSGQFAILARELKTAQEQVEMAAVLLNAFRFPVCVEDRVISANLSVGLADCLTGHGFDEALHRAAASSELVCSRGGGRWCRFGEPGEDPPMVQQLIDEEILCALEVGEVFWRRVPRFDVGTGATVGTRLIAEWAHPGPVPHSLERFSTFLNSPDAIRRLTTMQVDVMLKSCRELPVPGRIFIRATPGQVEGGALADILIPAARRQSGESGRLGVEFPEELLPSLGRRIDRLVSELSSLGVHCSVAGMGSGATSLDYLGFRCWDSAVLNPGLNDGLLHNPTCEGFCDDLLRVMNKCKLSAVWPGTPDPLQKEWLVHRGCRIFEPSPGEWTTDEGRAPVGGGA